MAHSQTRFLFTKAELHKQDFSLFLKYYDPSKLSREKLMDRMGRLVFLAEDHDSLSPNLFISTEVKLFYQKLRDAWPYLLFFADFGYPSSTVMIYNMMSDLTIKHRDEDRELTLVVQKHELITALLDLYPPTREMCLQYQLPPELPLQRLEAALAAFRLRLVTFGF